MDPLDLPDLVSELGFRRAVWEAVRLIPQGRVLGYGHVATMLGSPRAARQVGYALAALEPGTDVPWWRVIRSDGTLALQGDPARGPRQADLLAAEDIEVIDWRVEMAVYRWGPRRRPVSDTDPPRTPVRPLPAPGAPPPGAPAVMWSERGMQTGGEVAPLTVKERMIGGVALLLWRWLGLLLLPLLTLYPRSRKHLWGVPAPSPGWTWLHGASAGEHVAARALADVLEPQTWRTRSSLRTPVPGTFPAPFDLPFLFARWLDRARPARLVLVEAELWPGWLWHCRRRGIPVAVVNARPGRGTSRWRRFGPLWRWLTHGVVFISQEETGDLKLSTQLRSAVFDLGREAFIAASTRPGDEVLLLDAWTRLEQPPLLVLAPRHLKRVDEVVALLDGRGLQWRKRSAGIDDLGQVDVLLLDSMGELSTLYQQARAAFIGGTFDADIGGHSPAEPFAAGIPVVSGPHQHSNPVAWQNGIALKVGATEGPEAVAQLAAAVASAMKVGPQPTPDSEAAMRAAALLPPGQTPDERAARPLLWPLVPVVRVIGRRRRAWSGGPIKVPVPVVSVGALAAGGAGKTPAVAWLAQRLQQELGPDAVWVVARGYRRGPGPAVRAAVPGAGWEAAYLGDELELLRRRGIPVVSAPDRVAGAEEALRQGARLVLLDDGFQHRRLHRNLDIVCIDSRWPDARGPIPVGERREPWSGLDRANWLWLGHGDSPILRPGRSARRPEPVGLPAGEKLPRVDSRIRPLGWLHQGTLLPLDAVTGPVRVAAGIARPERFLSTLMTLGLDIENVRLVSDHGNLGRLQGGAVVTEKDAARLPLDADVHALVLELELFGQEALVEQILGRVAD